MDYTYENWLQSPLDVQRERVTSAEATLKRERARLDVMTSKKISDAMFAARSAALSVGLHISCADDVAASLRDDILQRMLDYDT